MPLFKSFFFKKGNTKKINGTLSADFARNVEKSIELLGNNPGSLTDKEVIQLLTENGTGYNEAVEILLFLPIAFVRHLLPHLKWHNSYIEFISDKKKIEKKYRETKSFQIIFEAARNYFENSPKSDTIIKIA